MKPQVVGHLRANCKRMSADKKMSAENTLIRNQRDVTGPKSKMMQRDPIPTYVPKQKTRDLKMPTVETEGQGLTDADNVNEPVVVVKMAKVQPANNSKEKKPLLVNSNNQNPLLGYVDTVSDKGRNDVVIKDVNAGVNEKDDMELLSA